MPDRPVAATETLRWAVCLCLASLLSVVVYSRPSPGSELRRTPIVRAVESVRPSVVNIRGEKTLEGALAPAGDSARRVNGMGTGVVIDPSGYIITNHHVIDGVRQIRVTTSEGSQYVARLVNRDPETDLAIIKIDRAAPLPVINIGTSKDLMTGEPVVAVGNAYGYENTATRGIISALHRAVQVSDAQYYDDLIQTDASINPGNSGGPLLNIDGEMIGINVAVRAGAQGIGFAIPVDKVVDVAAKLLAARGLQEAWHGVEVTDDPAQPGRTVVRSVADNSPGANAGLAAGDVITSVRDVNVTRPLDFHRAVLGLEVGRSVDLVVRRGDERLKLTLKLAKVPGDLVPALGPHWELLGVQLRPIPTQEFQQKYRTRYRGGLAITAVRPNGPAAGQGIRPGDVLVGMHIWETISLKNVDYVVKYVSDRPDSAALNPLKFYVLRGDETLYGFLPMSLAVQETSRR